MKKLEDKIKRITGNENFKISSEEYYYSIKNLFNNMLSDLIEIKAFEKQLERKYCTTKTQFINLIEELCNNKEFYKLLDDDLPCLKSILDYISENNENKIDIKDLIIWIEKRLDNFNHDEDVFYILNEEFKNFYKMNIEKLEIKE